MCETGTNDVVQEKQVVTLTALKGGKQGSCQMEHYRVWRASRIAKRHRPADAQFPRETPNHLVVYAQAEIVESRSMKTMPAIAQIGD